jgi:hypothetical protein
MGCICLGVVWPMRRPGPTNAKETMLLQGIGGEEGGWRDRGKVNGVQSKVFRRWCRYGIRRYYEDVEVVRQA